MILICKVCNNETDHNLINITEKMIGTFNQFQYSWCVECGVLELYDSIQDFSPYYTSNYYSLKNTFKEDSYIIKLSKKIRLELYRYLRNYNVFSSKYFPNYYNWLIECGSSKKNKILDVGSGTGKYLFALKNHGYDNLFGLDPFIPKDIINDGISIFKKNLLEFTETNFDTVIFNHSLEHMEDHERILLTAKEKLNKTGIIIIRIPIQGRSFEIYKENWVELDAPRHCIIHTQKSIELLLNRVGLRIKKVFYDTDEFEFWGSEQFCKNIATLSSKSYVNNPEDSIFSAQQLKYFRGVAHDYNKRGIAGRVCLIAEHK